MRNLDEAIFWEIFFRRDVLRSDLARTFKISPATVSRSVSLLMSHQMVIEQSAPPPFRGRRPAQLGINPDIARVAGIEIDRDRATAVVTDMAGGLLGRGAVDLDPRLCVDSILAACHRAFEIALDDAGLKPKQIDRVGVGQTGMLDVEKGICLEWQGIPQWQGLPLRDRLQTVFELPVTLDDRSRAIGLALHLLDEQNRRHRSAIYVNIGTGIGACILLDGRILRGTTLAGGEIGHMVIDGNGPVCQCGNRGCVESFASLPATLARASAALTGGAKSSLQSLSPRGLTAELLVSAALGGDELAGECMAQTTQALGTGIANAVQLLNPSLVVLAGKFCSHFARPSSRPGSRPYHLAVL
jgi:N-acetylglucosamine repressor